MKCLLAIAALCLLPPHKIEEKKTVVVHDHCLIYEKIIASRKDTPGTLKQVLRENTKYRRICPETGAAR